MIRLALTHTGVLAAAYRQQRVDATIVIPSICFHLSARTRLQVFLPAAVPTLVDLMVMQAGHCLGDTVRPIARAETQTHDQADTESSRRSLSTEYATIHHNTRGAVECCHRHESEKFPVRSADFSSLTNHRTARTASTSYSPCLSSRL